LVKTTHRSDAQTTARAAKGVWFSSSVFTLNGLLVAHVAIERNDNRKEKRPV